MLIKPHSIRVNNEIISTAILSKNSQPKSPNFVFLHGGAGNKERIYNLIPPIVESNIDLLTMDFSGHGQSTGEIKKSSLKKRIEEANAAIIEFATKDPLIVCGASMGGYLAIKMLEYHKVKTLILLCPALYDKKAYNLRFDDGFTEAIREFGSWKHTDILESLENFSGKLLVVIGDNDTVIPSGVIDLIMQHTQRAQKKELYILQGCPHKMFDWLNKHEDEMAKLQLKILDYIHQN